MKLLISLSNVSTSAVTQKIFDSWKPAQRASYLEQHPRSKFNKSDSVTQDSLKSLDAQLNTFRSKHAGEIEAFYDIQRQYSGDTPRTAAVREKIRKLRTKNVETYLDLKRKQTDLSQKRHTEKTPSKKKTALKDELDKYEKEIKTLNSEMYGPKGTGNEKITDAQFDALAKKLNLAEKKVSEVQKRLNTLEKNRTT